MTSMLSQVLVRPNTTFIASTGDEREDETIFTRDEAGVSYLLPTVLCPG